VRVGVLVFDAFAVALAVGVAVRRFVAVAGMVSVGAFVADPDGV
jgi:hypothetical protein